MGPSRAGRSWSTTRSTCPPCSAVGDGSEQGGQVERVVLQVRILNDDHVAGGEGDPGADGGAFPAVLRVAHELIDLAGGTQALEDVPGAVA